MINWKIVHLKKIDSTNNYLCKLIKENEQYNNGYVIVAEKQTKGRGRLMRQWESSQGGLFFSFSLSPPDIIPILSLLTGLALLKGIKKITQVDIKLKWPNDLIINNKKLGGILIESIFSGNKLKSYIIGCGINVNQTFFSPELSTAISLYLLKNKNFKLDTVLMECLNSFDFFYNEYLTKGSEIILKQWKENSCTLGNFVNININDEKIKGYAQDINTDGSLILKLENGLTKIINFGDVAAI